MEKGMTLEEFKQKVLKIIRDRNEQLETLFEDGKYPEMPGKFTANARLVTHEGEIIPGEDSENYWRKVGGELKATNLKFKEKYFDAMALSLNPEHTEDDFDFIAFEITEFSFEAKGQQYRGYIDPPYRHRRRCTIY